MQGLAKQSINIMDTFLVSFGNYILKKYGVMVHSTDGKNEPIYQRLVTDADLTNWRDQENPKFTLPSRFQIGNSVELDFYGCGEVRNCKVIKVHFTESKVLYDVVVNDYTRLYNIDSVNVVPMREYKPLDNEPFEMNRVEPLSLSRD